MYDAERRLPDNLVDEFVSAIKDEHCCVNNGQQRYFNLDHCRKSLKALLAERKDMFEKKLTSTSLHEQQQARLFDAVKAWYSVEKKTFTDVVLKATKAHVLDGQRQWAQSRLLGDANVREAAVEDDRT